MYRWQLLSSSPRSTALPGTSQVHTTRCLSGTPLADLMLTSEAFRSPVQAQLRIRWQPLCNCGVEKVQLLLQLTQCKFWADAVWWIPPSCANYMASGLHVNAGLEVGWCKDPDRGLPAPDKIIFLDISVEDAMKVQRHLLLIVYTHKYYCASCSYLADAILALHQLLHNMSRTEHLIAN